MRGLLSATSWGWVHLVGLAQISTKTRYVGFRHGARANRRPLAIEASLNKPMGSKRSPKRQHPPLSLRFGFALLPAFFSRQISQNRHSVGYQPFINCLSCHIGYCSTSGTGKVRQFQMSQAIYFYWSHIPYFFSFLSVFGRSRHTVRSTPTAASAARNKSSAPS
jgi:hypothetical protein